MSIRTNRRKFGARGRLAALTLVVAGLVLGACGSKQDDPDTRPQTERLELMLDFYPNADHAPIYAAQEIGAFRDAGLDVKIRTPADPGMPIKMVTTGRVDLAISYEPEVLLARDKGARVASVGALVQKPLTSIMTLRDDIRSVKDLAGKTVGTAGIPYQSAYLRTALEKAAVNPDRVREVNVGFNLSQAMLSKKVDATLGGFWNYEGVQLRRRGRKPRIIRMEQVGVPTYQELVFVGHMDTLRERGRVLRRFLQAVARGARALRTDPTVGLDTLLKANPDLERGLQQAVVKETLPVFFPEGDFPWGYQNADEWKAYGEWMLENKLLQAMPSPTALTNEFLPGHGV